MQEQESRASSQSPDLEQLLRRAMEFAKGAKARSTIKAYASDFRDFESFCAVHGLSALPAEPQTVAMYIADRASTLAAGTITRRLTSITRAHREADYKDSPASSSHAIVGETLRGIRRALGTAQKGKDPLLASDIRKIVKSCPANIAGLRDRCLVLIGFAGAFRGAELASIEVRDLSFSDDGVVIHLRTSKTDQESAGRKVAIPFSSDREACSVRALQLWLRTADISEGLVLRGVDRLGRVSRRGLWKDSIGTILKKAAARAGMKIESIAGHSLRAGHATQSALNHVEERTIARQTGHRSMAMLRRYIRNAEMFRDNSAAHLGI